MLSIAGAATAGIRCESTSCCRRHPRAQGCDGGTGRQAATLPVLSGAEAPAARNTTLSRHEAALARLYASSRALDVGPQPISQLELEQGAKLVRSSWIRRFDSEAVEAAYHERFMQQQLAFGEQLEGEPILCMGARLGGEGECQTAVELIVTRVAAQSQ